MKIIRPQTLALFSGPNQYCGWCGMASTVSAHHVFSRGAGRLDIRCNLIGLCNVFSGGENCHDAFHNRHPPTRDQLLAKIAKRERTTPEDIKEVVDWLRRLPSRLSAFRIIEAVQQLTINSPGAANLAVREMKLAKIILCEMS